MTGYLILENGEIFEGERIGYNLDCAMELVTNNSNIGYMETLTDPNYFGEGVVMSYPLVGNCGIILEDFESEKIWLSALFINEAPEFESNSYTKFNFEKYLRDYKIPGLSNMDVKKLSEIINKEGRVKAYLTSNINNIDNILEEIKKYKIENAISQVSTSSIKIYGKNKSKKVAILDLGFKHNIVNSLLKRDVCTIIYPYNTTFEKILSSKPDGILISNGPGNPIEYKEQINTIKELVKSDIPILGIGLGHELLALANSFEIENLPKPHIGINYIIKNAKTNKLYVTSQNLRYCVKRESIKNNLAEENYICLEDKTNIGLAYKNKNILSVGFEPEGAPGPNDTLFIFDDFINKLRS